MKKIFIIFVIYCSLFITNYSSGQPVPLFGTNGFDVNIKEAIAEASLSYADSGRYFPLKIGNKFYYKYKHTYQHTNPDSTAYDSSYYISRITDTVRKNGYLYYKINTFMVDTAVGYFRFDADSGYLNVYNAWGSCSFDLRYFKLASVLNEMGLGPCTYDNVSRKCIDIKDTSVFETLKLLKRFYNFLGGTNFWRFQTTFVKDIGLTQYIYNYYSPMPGISITDKYDLIGAFVNGVKYGDTNTVGIRTISNAVPDKFSLYQNYPNPFNPTTKISYELPKSEFVKLVIYDIIGKEIETLVNEKQTAGTYEVTFNASKYSSGVYFYKLTSGEYSETKRMLLIK